MASTRVSKETVQEFLKNQEVIRVHIEGMPFGYGNQVSSQKLMQRIRALGFIGKFECIYFAGAENVNKNKIAKLFNLPQNFSNLYYDQATHSEFIEGSIYLHALHRDTVKRYPLSISGGQMEVCADAFANTNKHATPEQMHEFFNTALQRSPCNNDALMLESESYTRIDPYMGRGPRGRDKVSIITRQQKSASTIQNNSEQFHLTPFTSLPEAESLINSTEDYTQLAETLPGLTALFTARRSDDFYWIPSYGWPLQLHEKNRSKQDVFPDVILYVLTGVLMAQKKLSLTKPIIIPLFYDYQDEIKLLKAIAADNWKGLDEFLNFHGASHVKALLKQVNFNSHLKTSSLSEANFSKQLETLTANDIFLVSTGALPNAIFEGLYYEENNVLTYLFEGENTRNTLMAHTAKPYLRIWDWNFSQFNQTPADQVTKQRFELFHKLELSQKAEWVRDFIIDSMNEQSALTRYYKTIYANAKNEDNDRILNALKKTISLLTPESQTEAPIKSSTGLLYKFFNSMSNSFNQALASTEKRFSAFIADLSKECPTYFPEGVTLWSAQPASVSCASGFFGLNNQCIRQPTPPPILTNSLNEFIHR